MRMKTIDQILLENLNKEKNSIPTPGTRAGKTNRAMTATEIMTNKLKYHRAKLKKRAQFKEEVQN